MGRILVPSNKLITPEYGMGFSAQMGMAGRYRLQSHKAKSGTLRKDTGWFSNIITDNGLWLFHTMPNVTDFIGDTSICGTCAVGSGNTTPTIADTGLANYIASAQGTSGSVAPGPNVTGYVAAVAPDPAYYFNRWQYQFGTGLATGNLTEVGAYPAGGSKDMLFSRSLIVDGAGNPTSITVLSDEILTVTYELRFYLDPTDKAFTFNLNGSPITGTYRLMNMGSVNASFSGRPDQATPDISMYTGDIGAATGAPTGFNGHLFVNYETPTLIQVVNDIPNSGTCYIDWQGTFGVNDAIGTLKSFSFVSHMWSYQFGLLSSPIIKGSGQQLQVNFRGVWGRYSG